MLTYAQIGLPYLWLLDPEQQTLEVYVLQENQHWLLWKVYQNTDDITAPSFDAVTFNLGVLWKQEDET